MARQVLPIAGAVIGGIVSGGNPYAIQAGAMIGPILGEIMEPAPEDGNDADEPA